MTPEQAGWLLEISTEVWPRTRERLSQAVASLGAAPRCRWQEWLKQYSILQQGLIAATGAALAKARRDSQSPLIQALVALDERLAYVERQLREAGIEQPGAAQPATRAFLDSLLRLAYAQPLPLILAGLFAAAGAEEEALASLLSTPRASFARQLPHRATPAGPFCLFGRLYERLPHELAGEIVARTLVVAADWWDAASGTGGSA